MAKQEGWEQIGPKVDPRTGYGQNDEGRDLPAPDPVVAEIELIMRQHLPVKVDDGVVLCLDDVATTFHGPVYQRWHVAELIAEAICARRVDGAAPPEPERCPACGSPDPRQRGTVMAGDVDEGGGAHEIDCGHRFHAPASSRHLTPEQARAACSGQQDTERTE